MQRAIRRSLKITQNKQNDNDDDADDNDDDDDDHNQTKITAQAAQCFKHSLYETKKKK